MTAIHYNNGNDQATPEKMYFTSTVILMMIHLEQLIVQFSKRWGML